MASLMARKAVLRRPSRSAVPEHGCSRPPVTVRDELLTRKDQQALAAAIPASRLIVYQDTGHLVLWEQPERVAADLTAFVDSLRGQPA